ncbi:MAG: phosphate regulon transcriptional regulatory protein PhoB [Pseudomonadota bacterium]|jgi:two-component system phosphate regulon response regulator PhoB
MKKPYIIIVEDEAAIAELVAINLRHSGFECDIACDSAQAQDMVFERMPDLVLLDWMLPTMSGFSLAKQWRSQAETKQLPIIMLTARAEEVDKVASLDAGVDDYMTKPFSTRELLARVRAVLRRRAPDAVVSGGTLTSGAISLDSLAHRVTAEGKEIKLAPTEFKLLTALLQQGDKVLKRETLQNMVWGHYSDIDERTVDVHIKRLREALTTVSVAAASQIETIRGMGYRLSKSAP